MSPLEKLAYKRMMKMAEDLKRDFANGKGDKSLFKPKSMDEQKRMMDEIEKKFKIVSWSASKQYKKGKPLTTNELRTLDSLSRRLKTLDSKNWRKK